MAPKPVVPVDFGIENLYSEFHGNIVVKLENNAQMLANSMILTYNSPVFGDIFRNLELRTVDMDDFSGAVVARFLESLYTGEVELNKQLFREMSKMANVFKVTWLISRCESYFADLVQTVDGSDYESIMFIFEEAMFQKNSVKKPEYLDIVLEKLTNTANIETVFIERYMADYKDFSTNQLDLMIDIAGENVHIFMKIMKQNMITNGLNFDGKLKYLLQHVDLVRCMEHDTDLYEEVFDMLFEKAKNISTQDLMILVKLNREAAKEYRLRERSKLEADLQPTTSGIVQTALVMDIPNICHSYKQFADLTKDQYVDALLTSPDVKNLYMVFEAIELMECYLYSQSWELLTRVTLQKVIKTKQTRGWCAVKPYFIDSISWLTIDHPAIMARIKSCRDLVSSTDSVRIVCNDYTNLRDLIIKEKTIYKFYFPHSVATPCCNPTKCGFVVKVSPLTKESPGSFNIQLVTDPALYPVNIIHCHDSMLSAENMHLVVEWYSEDDNKWHNDCVSWDGEPEYKDDEVYWAGAYCTDSRVIRLAMYYNPTK